MCKNVTKKEKEIKNVGKNMGHSVKFAGNPVELLGKEVKVGEKAPDFRCVGVDLKDVRLSQFDGKIKIISVFPSIDTSVCSLQTKRFNLEADKLGDRVVLISISNDLPFAQSRYCAAEGIKHIVMASDHRDVDFSMKYGFLMEGLRLLARGVIVLDANNVVRYVEYVPEVTHEPDYDKALQAVKALLQ